jgi:hypothetical protein
MIESGPKACIILHEVRLFLKYFESCFETSSFSTMLWSAFSRFVQKILPSLLFSCHISAFKLPLGATGTSIAAADDQVGDGPSRRTNPLMRFENLLGVMHVSWKGGSSPSQAGPLQRRMTSRMFTGPSYPIKAMCNQFPNPDLYFLAVLCHQPRRG